MDCLAVGLGGFLGAISRYLLGFVPGYYYLSFPVGTMLINFVGSFGIGLVVGAASLGTLSAREQLFLKTGFCGGFTTFSTFSLESITLLEQGHWFMAGGYIICSLLLCLAGVIVGKFLALRFFA